MFDRFINQKNLKKYKAVVEKVNSFYVKNKLEDLTVNELRDMLLGLRNSAKSPKEKIVCALAIAKAGVKSVIHISPYDVQVIGALALIDGNMAEMKTGEGKTLTCALANIVNYSLSIKTHVATANEYLAKRDNDSLAPIYEALGIKSMSVLSTTSRENKRLAYSSDVVYSTASELGFDYLRDNLVLNLADKSQQANFKDINIIIDEADFVLIDEATTPLIISGNKKLREINTYNLIREITSDFIPVSKSPSESSSILDNFVPDGDFWLDKKSKSVYLSEEGYKKLEKNLTALGISEQDAQNEYALYDTKHSWLINEVNQCLMANWIYEKDKDYAVLNDEIVIIDPNTGRLAQGRSWSNGLHQAIEAKEGVRINPENATTGSITIQNFLKNYRQISGMSGTIMQSSQEFEFIYNSPTISIPPNKPSARIDEPDRIYINEDGKYRAMILEIVKAHTAGQPILVGTISVAESELVSDLLSKEGITHSVINAKNHTSEAKIIAQAGRKSRVTVATSMAGRGTDIILGGNKEVILEEIYSNQRRAEERINFIKELIEELVGNRNYEISIDQDNINLDYELNESRLSKFYDIPYLESEIQNQRESQLFIDLYQEINNYLRQIVHIHEVDDKDKAEVVSLGGLLVVGSSRNNSRRIDNQLIGRAGRQGDPGRSVFFMSFEDPWIKVFGNMSMMRRVLGSLPRNLDIRTKQIEGVFYRAQEQIQSQYYSARKDAFQYDSVSNDARKSFYEFRDYLLSDKRLVVREILIKTIISSFCELSNPYFEDYLVENDGAYKYTQSNQFEWALTQSVQDLLAVIESFRQSNHTLLSLDKLKKEYGSTYEKFYDMVDDYLGEVIPRDQYQSVEPSDVQFSLTTVALKSVMVLDDLWGNYLSNIDLLKKSVRYVSFIQKNPLHEFTQLSYSLFESMMLEFNDLTLNSYLYARKNMKEMMEAALSQSNKKFSKSSVEDEDESDVIVKNHTVRLNYRYERAYGYFDNAAIALSKSLEERYGKFY